MPKPYKFNRLRRALRKYDKRFEFWENRGKGSERMIYHPDIDGDGQSSVYVEGTIHNANDVDVGGYLEITVMVDGRYADSTTLTMIYGPTRFTTTVTPSECLLRLAGFMLQPFGARGVESRDPAPNRPSPSSGL